MRRFNYESDLIINGVIELDKDEMIEAIKTLDKPGEPEFAPFNVIIERYFLEFMKLGVGNWIVNIQSLIWDERKDAKTRKKLSKLIVSITEKRGVRELKRCSYTTLLDDYYLEVKSKKQKEK